VSRKLTLLCPLGLAVVAGSTVHAAAQQSVSTSAGAEVIAPSLSITEVNPVAFGRIKSSTSGTVTIDVHGIRTATGGVTLVGSGQCTTTLCDTTNQSSPNSASFWSPGVYTITGIPNAAYRVIAATSATATLKSGSGAPLTLPVTNVVVATDSSGWNSTIGTINPTGQGTIRVGGTLAVPGGLSSSSYYAYEVDIPVTVQYN
jgi:hypothetical protein